MQSLTTRAQADHYRRQQLRTLPAPPTRFVPAADRPAYRLATSLLRLVLTLLALLVLGTALYPAGNTRPLRVADEAPAESRAAWHESDYTTR